jgi:hypothetical protein
MAFLFGEINLKSRISAGYMRTGCGPAPVTERDPTLGPACDRLPNQVLVMWLSASDKPTIYSQFSLGSVWPGLP